MLTCHVLLCSLTHIRTGLSLIRARKIFLEENQEELGLAISTSLNRWYNFRQVSQPLRFHAFSSVCNIRMEILNMDENISNQRVSKT